MLMILLKIELKNKISFSSDKKNLDFLKIHINIYI